jgi:hypothetical protein
LFCSFSFLIVPSSISIFALHLPFILNPAIHDPPSPSNIHSLLSHYRHSHVSVVLHIHRGNGKKE